MVYLSGHSVTNLRPDQGIPSARSSLQQAVFIFLILLIIQWVPLALHAHLSSLSHYKDAIIIIISIHKEESEV